MKICVAGWYYRPNYLRAIFRSGFDSFVVKHREGNAGGLPSKLYPNLGLEFGAYRQYVMNDWDDESDVFFTHDDVEVTDECAFRDIAGLRKMGVEHAYIFQDETHEFVNGGAHGRAMWIRGDILRQMKMDFPADMENEGKNIGLDAQKGILMFHERIMKCGKNTGVIALVPQFRFAHRGRLHEELFVYRRHNTAVPGGVVNVAQ